jgi:hypothetical protein
MTRERFIEDAEEMVNWLHQEGLLWRRNGVSNIAGGGESCREETVIHCPLILLDGRHDPRSWASLFLISLVQYARPLASGESR